MSRIDTYEDLAYMRGFDVFIGLMFATAFFLGRRSDPPTTPTPRRLPTAVGVLLVWVLASGALLLWHEAQVRIRDVAP
jgi:hypothetical protein